MKKSYSLLATLMVATCAFAQTTIFSGTFNDVTGTGGNDGLWNGSIGNTGFANGSTSYTTGGAWTLSNAYKGDHCLKLGTGSLKGSVTTPSVTMTGAGTLSFKVGAWNGASEATTLKVIITGGTFGNGVNELSLPMSKGAFMSYTFLTGVISAGANITFTFEANGATNNRFFIDDIIIMDNSTLGVNDVNSKKSNFVKNTSVDNEVFFGNKSDVKVYNANGSLIKTASVSESKSLNVSEFPKGMYIVTGAVNGKNVSEKIVKK